MSFWINKYNLGIRKIVIVEVGIFFLSLLLIDNNFYFILVNLLPIFFFISLIFWFGFFIRMERFKVNNKIFEVVYYFLPRDFSRSFKSIMHRGNIESKLPIFNHKKLLYFDVLEDLLNPDEDIIDSALILGGSGGSVPFWLAKNFKTHSIVVVEISKKVISVAKKYFIKNESSNIKFVHADAIEHLNGEEKFDLIFLDVFDGDKVDNGILCPKFIKNLKESTKGFLFINFGLNYKEKQNKIVYLLLKIYKKIIPNIEIFILANNFVGIYSNSSKNKNYKYLNIGTRIL